MASFVRTEHPTTLLARDGLLMHSFWSLHLGLPIMSSQLPHQLISSQPTVMAEHPSFTLAGLREHAPVYCLIIAQMLTTVPVSVGGTAGYLRTRSTPSLVAGILLGASYGYSGKLFPIKPDK